MKKLIPIALLIIPFMSGCSKLMPTILGNSAPQKATKSDNVIRILIAGQSNGTSTAQGVPDAASTTGMVKVSFPKNADVLVSPTLSDPAHVSVAWVYLGDMLAANIGKKVEIYNVASANTTTQVWKDDRYLRAIAELKKHRFDAVLWVQGESDYGYNISTEDSFANLKFVIQQCQSVQFVPWYVAIDSGRTELRKVYLGTSERVTQAQERIISAGLANRGPDLMALHDECYFMDGNGAEFIGPAMKEHAQLWFNILNAARPWND